MKGLPVRFQRIDHRRDKVIVIPDFGAPCEEVRQTGQLLLILQIIF
jgi:hypothetical protein